MPSPKARRDWACPARPPRPCPIPCSSPPTDRLLHSTRLSPRFTTRLGPSSSPGSRSGPPVTWLSAVLSRSLSRRACRGRCRTSAEASARAARDRSCRAAPEAPSGRVRPCPPCGGGRRPLACRSASLPPVFPPTFVAMLFPVQNPEKHSGQHLRRRGAGEGWSIARRRERSVPTDQGGSDDKDEDRRARCRAGRRRGGREAKGAAEWPRHPRPHQHWLPRLDIHGELRVPVRPDAAQRLRAILRAAGVAKLVIRA